MSIFKTVSGMGENIVIIHGWGCDQRYMQPLVEQLSNRYCVTNIDLPGRGQSAWESQIHTIHDIADRLLSSLPDQSATYIGWSFGGLVSTSIAARYPERVKRFIGIATTPKFIASADWNGIPAPGFSASFNGIETQGVKNFFQAFYESEFTNFDPKPDAYYHLLKLLDETPAAPLEILFKGMKICDITDLRQEFQSLRSDVNIHVINDACHMPFWTHKEKFNKLLNAILLNRTV